MPSETITQTLSIGENDYDIERTQLNDAANALLMLCLDFNGLPRYQSYLTKVNIFRV